MRARIADGLLLDKLHLPSGDNATINDQAVLVASSCKCAHVERHLAPTTPHRKVNGPYKACWLCLQSEPNTCFRSCCVYLVGYHSLDFVP
jgi:hypothetical protein